jgi:hypothetical protein
MLNLDIDGTQLTALLIQYFIKKGGGDPFLPNFLLTSVSLCFQGKNLLVIGTSEVGFLESIGMCDAFSATYHVPKLKKEDAKKVRKYIIEMLNVAVISRSSGSAAGVTIEFDSTALLLFLC